MRGYEQARAALVLASSGEVQTINMGGATHCVLNGYVYRYDSADTTFERVSNSRSR